MDNLTKVGLSIFVHKNEYLYGLLKKKKFFALYA